MKHIAAILGALLLASPAFSQYTNRFAVNPNSTRDINITHKAHNQANWLATITGVDLTDHTPITCGVKSAKADNTFFALSTGTVVSASAGTVLFEFPTSSWVTNNTVDVSMYGDIRLTDFDLPLPSLLVTLKPSFNYGTETYISPANHEYQTNGTSIGTARVINFDSTFIASKVDDTLTLSGANPAWDDITSKPAAITNYAVNMDQDVSSTGTPTFASANITNAFTLFDLPWTWNPTVQTYDITFPDGEVGQLFQEQFVYARNQTGVLIAEGRVVCITDPVGDNAAIKLASNDDPDCKWKTLGVVTRPGGIPTGESGKVATFGDVNDLPLAAFPSGSNLWLNTGGLFTLTEPDIHLVESKVFLGSVLRSHVSEGRLRLQIQAIPNAVDVGAEDSYYSTSDGLLTGRHSTFIETDGTSVWFETELIGGGDLTAIFDSTDHVLDCTTGAGVGGRARIALNVGTDVSPQPNWIYLADGGATATLSVSTTRPSDERTMLAYAIVPSAAMVLADGSTEMQRWSDAVDYDGLGMMARAARRIRKIGSAYGSGITPTINADGTVSTTSGEAWQFNPQIFPAFPTNSVMKIVNDFTTPYRAITNLNQITHDSQGVAIPNNSYIAIWLGGYVGSGEDGASELLIWLPSDTYGVNEEADAKADSMAYDDTTIPPEKETAIFAICRIVAKSQTGPVLSDFTVQDRRRQTLSSRGGGGASPASINADAVIATGTYANVQAALNDQAGLSQYNVFTSSNVMGGVTIWDSALGVTPHRVDLASAELEYNDNPTLSWGQFGLNLFGAWNLDHSATGGVNIVNHTTATNLIETLGGYRELINSSEFNPTASGAPDTPYTNGIPVIQPDDASNETLVTEYRQVYTGEIYYRVQAYWYADVIGDYVWSVCGNAHTTTITATTIAAPNVDSWTFTEAVPATGMQDISVLYSGADAATTATNVITTWFSLQVSK